LQDFAAGDKVKIVFRERHVKLFRRGGRQAARIPREFELPGKYAILPATLAPFGEDFLPMSDPRPEPVEFDVLPA
jgi:hypothetical protein